MMQSRVEEQASLTQNEETEDIQHLEIQPQQTYSNSNDLLKESTSKGCCEINNTDKCLITVNHKQYEQRITNLQDLIFNVRQKLKQEKDWWDTQIAELKMKVLDYSPDYLDYCSSPKNAISMDVHAQLLESPRANSVYNFALDNKESMDYERKLKCYQEALTLAQFEKHQNMKRQLAAHAYKKKLLEIEQLCNVELSRIRQNACMLEPLNKVASEWKLSSAESTGQKKWKGDSLFSSYTGKIPMNLCDMNLNADEDYKLGLYGEPCKGDTTTSLNLISEQHSDLNEALVQNDKSSDNAAQFETLNTNSKPQRSEFEAAEKND